MKSEKEQVKRRRTGGAADPRGLASMSGADELKAEIRRMKEGTEEIQASMVQGFKGLETESFVRMSFRLVHPKTSKVASGVVMVKVDADLRAPHGMVDAAIKQLCDAGLMSVGTSFVLVLTNVFNATGTMRCIKHGKESAEFGIENVFTVRGGAA